MNKEKQQIISDICPFYKEYGTCEQCNKDLDIDDEPCYFECMANAIINNNYVKQSKGEWISQADGTHYCSNCGHDATFTYDGAEVCGVACSFCGASMKGGAE